MLERGLLATAVLLVLGVIYVLRDSVPVEIRRLVTGSQDAGPARQTATPTPVSKRAARLDRGLRGRTARSADLAAVNGPVSTTVIYVQIPPFPEAPAIRPGMSSGDVVHRFGPPNWKATWADLRTLNEKYTYVDHQRTTELLIQAGRVVSCQTGAPSNRLSGSQISIDWD